MKKKQTQQTQQQKMNILLLMWVFFPASLPRLSSVKPKPKSVIIEKYEAKRLVGGTIWVKVPHK